MKNKKNIITIIITLIILVIIYFLCAEIFGYFPAFILNLSFIMSIYCSKYFDYISLSNSKYDVELSFNKIGIPRIKYNGVIILRQIADSYIWASRLLAVSFPMLIVIIVKFFLKFDDTYIYWFPIIGTALGILFHINDIKKLWKIWFGKRNSFHIKFLEDDVERIETQGVKYSHREVFFYQEAYSKFTIADLEREYIFLEQEIADNRKQGFWDKYLLPVLFIITTSILGFLNAVFISEVSSKSYDIVTIFEYYLIMIFLISLIVLQIFIIKHFMFTSKKVDLILKKLVVQNFIEEDKNNK